MPADGTLADLIRADVAAPPPPFIIYAMPRSRTAWLSTWLSYGPWRCTHDAVAGCDTFADVEALLRRPYSGICETGFNFAARAMFRLVQEARVVVVRRDPAAVECSLARLGWKLPAEWYEEQGRMLDRAAALPGALTVDFDDLGREETAAAIFTHCLGLPFDRAWWEQHERQNIQADFAACLTLGQNRRPYYAAMAAEAAAVAAEMPAVQNESWDQFFADAKPLFAEHYAEAGPVERLGYDPDFAIAAKASRLGMLQITTARTAAGRLVGYLLCQVENHVEDRRVLRGIQIPFFIRRAYRGPLALKMHRFMRASLAARGVKLLTVRSGVRAAGLRQDALFKYLRARPDGHMFTMNIGEA